MKIETKQLEELKLMSSDELLVFMKLMSGIQAFEETCLHEAAHAVIAAILNVPFEYVTVCPEITDSGELMAGHLRWGDNVWRLKRDEIEAYALAVIAPRVALPRLGIERSLAEDDEEFSGDEAALSIFLRFSSNLIRQSLVDSVGQMLTPATLSAIHRVANELKIGKTLNPGDVAALLKE